jgi:Tfp pilus assembly protein PilV
MSIPGLERRCDRTGLTLIEIMIAAGILAVALVMMMGIYVRTARSNDLARERNIALNAAKSVMEQIFSDAPSNVDSYNDPAFDRAYPELTGPDGNAAQIQVTVSQAPDHPTLRIVTVSVGWIPGVQPLTLTALRRSM